MGRSRAVRNPAGASRITGMELTTTEAVAISPWEPPGITRLMFGCPRNSIVSAGAFAPTCLHHAQGLGMLEAHTPARERAGQFVQPQAGISAGSDQCHAAIFGFSIELRRQIWVRAIRIGKLLASRNHARLSFEAGKQLVHHF